MVDGVVVVLVVEVRGGCYLSSSRWAEDGGLR
jgi:hypothetical protein